MCVKSPLPSVTLCDMAQRQNSNSPTVAKRLHKIQRLPAHPLLGAERALPAGEEGKFMGTPSKNLIRRAWQTLGSIKTGVLLLIITVIISAAGTVILQRPATDPDEIQRAYSPQMLRLLDAVGLTDVFHAWWFVLLLTLVSMSIIAASIQRFPQAWRFYSRPYKSPDETFRKALPVQAQIAVPDEETGLAAANAALHKAGFRPERIVRENSFS